MSDHRVNRERPAARNNSGGRSLLSLVRLVRERPGGIKEFKTYPCTHIEVRIVPEDCHAARELGEPPGITVYVYRHLAEGGVVQEAVLRLPEDGDAIYAMDQHGVTMDGYRWPSGRIAREAAAQQEAAR